MSFKLPGSTGPSTPVIPTIPTGPGGLVRPSDLTGGSLPRGPDALSVPPPKFLGRSNSMPVRRNVLPNMQATQHRGGGDEPPIGYPSSTPPSPGGNTPPLAQAAQSAAQTASNDAIRSQNEMMAQMQQTNLMSIQQQMQMAQMESIKSMATALAKTIKGVGKGVADLAS